MSTTESGPRIDTREMNVVHSMFRRELRLAGGLVRGVRPGDIARAGVVADHLALVERLLHHHHTTEDELLWPQLLDRVPAELAPIVELMEVQHRQVDGTLEQIGQLRPVWAGAPSRERGELLASRYDGLYAALAEHLDAEETRVLPLVARCITQEEWNALGDAGRRSSARSEMSLVFGMLQYDGDPAVVAQMLSGAPAPVRVLVPRLARRAYARRARRVHGTATP